MIKNDDWYTADAAAPLLGLTPAGVRSAIRDGNLAARKVGKRLHIVNGIELRRYQERQQTDPKSRGWATRRAMAHMDVAATMPEPPPEAPAPRLPLWARWSEMTPEYQADGFAILKPGDEGYDAAYDDGLRHGIRYATPDEIEQWDRDQNVSDQGE